MVQAALGTTPRVSVLQAWGQASPASPGLVPQPVRDLYIFVTGQGVGSGAQAEIGPQSPGQEAGWGLP